MEKMTRALDWITAMAAVVIVAVSSVYNVCVCVHIIGFGSCGEGDRIGQVVLLRRQLGPTKYLCFTSWRDPQMPHSTGIPGIFATCKGTWSEYLT